MESAENMCHIPDKSVALAFTSPPYNVGKDYDENINLTEYLSLIGCVAAEVYRVLKPGGRYVVNVANLGRKPYIPYQFVRRGFRGSSQLPLTVSEFDKSAGKTIRKEVQEWLGNLNSGQKSEFEGLYISMCHTVAEEKLGRKLNRKELKVVEDKIGDYIDWYEAITLALNEAVKLQKKSKALAKAQI